MSSTGPLLPATPAARAAARARAQELTPADRTALAKYGRPGLLKWLRVQVIAGWSTMTASLVVGFPLFLSEDIATQDAGLLLTMASIPGMVVAAHGQARITRVRANDPAAVLSRAVAIAPAPVDDTAELRELAALRSRLTELITAIEPQYGDVAAAMRSADEQAHRSLVQQARALSLLGDASSDAAPAVGAADEDGIASARAEIALRLKAGIAEYQHLMAQAALLLARTDAHLHVDAPLRAAADLAATYSEGIKISEDSGAAGR